ncbi:MAG TPA: carbohydrate-binding family 9-like protein [Fimbriimonadaceae bacterium]|nr:carbohydrate-binding family 9-like protein [Fimbriimonadaceae bacterium]
MRSYLCNKVHVPFSIDGDLSKPVWEAAPWTDDFVDIEGDVRPKPRFRTRAKMLWDERCLYVAAYLDEPHVWATLTEHDSVIFHDNDFELFLDPDGDNHLYAELEINALNTTWDMLMVKPYRDGGPPVAGWEIHGMQTAVRIDGTLNDPSDEDKGWSVEIALPWKALSEISGTQPCPPKAGNQMRINFSRVEWHTTIENGKYVKVPKTPEDNWVWSPQGVIDMHRPEHFGVIQFADGPAEIKPYQGVAEREALMRVYYAQRNYREAHGHWAGHVSKLDLSIPGLELFATPTDFEAVLGEWHVDAKSRLWKGDFAPAGRPTWD